MKHNIDDLNVYFESLIRDQKTQGKTVKIDGMYLGIIRENNLISFLSPYEKSLLKTNKNVYRIVELESKSLVLVHTDRLILQELN